MRSAVRSGSPKTCLSHLLSTMLKDVYKRQSYTIPSNAAVSSPLEKEDVPTGKAESENSSKDVYKRQSLPSSVLYYWSFSPENMKLPGNMYKIISTHHENYTHRNLDQTIRSIEEFLYHLFSREVPCKVYKSEKRF